MAEPIRSNPLLASKEVDNSRENDRGSLEKVGIVGAGPGGLATDIALQKQSIEVQIYERARAFRPIGAGLTLSPNGLRSLQATSLMNFCV